MAHDTLTRVEQPYDVLAQHIADTGLSRNMSAPAFMDIAPS